MAAAMDKPSGKYRRPGSSPRHRQQRVKNIAVLLLLLAMVALFYVLSIVRIGGSAG